MPELIQLPPKPSLIELIDGLDGQLRANEPLAKHTTWRIGGPADWFYEPANLEDLMAFLLRLPEDIPLFWLGLGSNILVRDGGIRGIVILTSGLLNEITQLNENTLRVEAGVSCAKIARFSVKAGLTGIEFLAGIPGTLGGALAMNAGAFGGEIWNVVGRVEVFDQYGHHYFRTPTDYQIGYRHVKMPEGEWFVAADLVLQADANAAIEGQAKIKALLQKRNETQPIGLASCGSVFRNPPSDYAARLIEQAGWKGRSIGDAYVSEKHANFIINRDQATAVQVENLIKQIQTDIQEKYGIWLEPEVKIIGEKC